MGCGASSAAPTTGAEPALRDPLFGGDALAAPEEEPGSEPPSAYAVTALEAAAPDASTVPVEEDGHDSAAIEGLELRFELAGGGRGGKSSIVHATAAGLAGKEAAAALAGVELGALHAALSGKGEVTEAAFADALRGLLPGAACPSAATMSALFRAFDTSGDGLVDSAELVAGCRALCGGDEVEKVRLAFSCFDADGDGHLSAAELAKLLRGSIEPAVNQLHAAVDFASFGSEGAADLNAIADESSGAAALSDAGDGRVRVSLQTKVGVATLLVPADALSPGALGGGDGVSIDAFVNALVGEAVSKYDTDGSGTLEADEFVAFGRANPFLSAWFGPALTEKGGASWRDGDVM